MAGVQGPPGGPGPQPPMGQPPVPPAGPPPPQPPPPAAAPVFIPPTREIRLNAPPVFDGNRKKYDNFLQAVLLYTSLNSHIFNTDGLKIGFTLSFLTDKEAAQWREAWVRRNATAGNINYPIWTVFERELSSAFRSIDQVGDAMHKLETLRQGEKTAEELNTEWDLLVGQADIGTDSSATLIKAYQKVLNRPLLEKILDGEVVPITIQGWKDKAVQLDNNYRRKMAILGKSRENRGQQNTGWRNQPFQQNNVPQKDPNAMDVDALSIKQREEALRSGACFKCRKIGHLARDPSFHPRYEGQGGRGGNAGQPGQPGMPGKTWTKGKDLLAHIRSLTAGLLAEEHEELMKGAEESGF